MEKIAFIGKTAMQVPSCHQNQASEPIPYRRGNDTPPNPSGIVERSYLGNGNDPKEYGQWLQSTGRQKWVKAKRRAV